MRKITPQRIILNELEKKGKRPQMRMLSGEEVVYKPYFVDKRSGGVRRIKVCGLKEISNKEVIKISDSMLEHGFYISEVQPKKHMQHPRDDYYNGVSFLVKQIDG